MSFSGDRRMAVVELRRSDCGRCSRQTGRTGLPARPRPRRSGVWVFYCRRACTLRPGRTGWSWSPGGRTWWSWSRRGGRRPKTVPGAWPPPTRPEPSNCSRMPVRIAWSSCPWRCALSTGPPAAGRTACLRRPCHPLRRWPTRPTSTSPATDTKALLYLQQWDIRPSRIDYFKGSFR